MASKLLLAAVLFGCGAPPPAQTCVLDPAQMPKAWRPAALGPVSPWSAAEQAASEAAVRAGFEEMVDFFAGRPERALSQWDNAVEAFIDVSYASAPTPELGVQGRAKAKEMLGQLLPYYLQREGDAATCDEAGDLLAMSVYAYALEHPERRRMAAMSNAATADCGGLQALLGASPAKVLAPGTYDNSAVYGLVMWSITLIEAQTIPELRLPEGATALPGQLWAYLAQLRTPDAATLAEGANDWGFYDTAYLMTHVGYLPTGYGRYALHRRDGEWLFGFLRRNFYAVLEMGELDLVAEFVDLFRQYGCSESNDRQVLDGSRHLLAIYRKAGRWMDHREASETAESNDYDRLHKPWTAIAGLRHRRFEAVRPGSYGAVVEALLGPR